MALERKSTALTELLVQRERDRDELEECVMENVRGLLLPNLASIHESLRESPATAHLDVLWSTLQEILRPIARSIDGATIPQTQLTRKERQVLSFIHAGKTTKEIAAALYVAPSTVSFHRRNLRRKFGLKSGGQRLATYLSATVRSTSSSPSHQFQLSSPVPGGTLMAKGPERSRLVVPTDPIPDRQSDALEVDEEMLTGTLVLRNAEEA